MANLNLPNAENQNRIAGALERIAAKEEAEVSDYTSAPGPKVLTSGNRTNGFYGFLKPEEFGEIESNPDANKKMNASNLALSIGLSQGTPINEGTSWMKFSRNGEIYFVPVKPLRCITTWNQLYEQGAVYGDSTVGVNPPNGRAGKKLSVDAATNSFLLKNIVPNEGFLFSGATLGKVGDTVVTRGFANAANNGEFVISSITDTAVTVTGSNLVTEGSAPIGSIYEKTKGVIQNRDVVIGGNRYRVQLLKGASQDPLNSFVDEDRDMVGLKSEWNNLILPLQEKAKIGDWSYPKHAGIVEDWKIGLTDKDLITHYSYGRGSYTWCQETSDDVPHARVIRGYNGASYGHQTTSWSTTTDNNGWRPVLRWI